MILRVLLIACLVAAAGGCARVTNERRAESLEAALQRYAKMLRWGEYEEAAKLIRFREREPVAVDYEALRQVRVTGYEVVERVVTPELNEARVLVRVSYTPLDSGVVRTLDDNQLWYYDEEQKFWFLDDDLPVFDTR